MEPCGLAADSGHLYWVDEGSPSYIGRSGLDGSNPEHEYVKIPGTSFPCGVAVNSANIFWADIGFFGGGTRIGRATISGSGPDASFIGDGSLVLSGKGIRRVARQAKQAGKVNLGLKPNGAGKKALSSAGKLKVRVKVAFTPTGGTTLAKSKSFVLKQSPGH